MHASSSWRKYPKGYHCVEAVENHVNHVYNIMEGTKNAMIAAQELYKGMESWYHSVSQLTMTEYLATQPEGSLPIPSFETEV